MDSGVKSEENGRGVDEGTGHSAQGAVGAARSDVDVTNSDGAPTGGTAPHPVSHSKKEESTPSKRPVPSKSAYGKRGPPVDTTPLRGMVRDLLRGANAAASVASATDAAEGDSIEEGIVLVRAEVLRLLRSRRKDKFHAMRAAIGEELRLWPGNAPATGAPPADGNAPDMLLLAVAIHMVERGSEAPANTPTLTLLLEALADLRGRSRGEARRREPVKLKPAAGGGSTDKQGGATGGAGGAPSPALTAGIEQASRQCAVLLNAEMRRAPTDEAAWGDISLMTLMWRAFDALRFLDRGAATVFVRRLLAEGAYGPASELIETLSLDDFNVADIVKGLAAANDWTQAERFVQTLPESAQGDAVEALIRLALTRQKFRVADRFARTFHSASQRSTTSSHFQRDVISRLVQDGQVSVAAKLVGASSASRAFLLEELMRSADYDAVRSLRSQFAMDGDPRFADEVIDDADRAQQAGAAACLELPEHVEVVDVADGAALAEMGELLRAQLREAKAAARPFVVGLDAEWRPTVVPRRGRGGTARAAPQAPQPGSAAPKGGTGGGGRRATWPVSVLQVATRSHVWLMDMLALHACEADMAAHFGWVVHDGSVVKLGFALDGDLGKLSGSYPAWAAVFGAEVGPVLDVVTAVQWARPQRSMYVSNLASTALEVLGKPVSKQQQLSDWQARPLTEEQRRYAALDAVVLVLLFDRIVRDVAGADVPPEGGPDGWRKLLTTIEPIPGAAPTANDPYTPASWAAAGAGAGDGAAETEVALRAVDLSALPDGDPTTPLGPDFVAKALETCGLSGDRLVETDHAATAEEAAAAVGVGTECIVKTLGFFAAGEPVVALIGGKDKLDPKKLATVVGCSRRKVKMANVKQCVETFGYEPGSFPPIGLRSKLPVYVDLRLATLDQLYCGGGSACTLLWLSSTELLACTAGRAVDLASGRAADEAAALEAAAAAARGEAQPAKGAAGAAEGGGEAGGGAGGRAGGAAGGPAFRYGGAAAGEVDPLRPRFLVDNMMGRLARWLRVVGVDAGYQHESNPDAIVAKASAEGRILLTRDRKLVQRRDCGESCRALGKHCSCAVTHSASIPGRCCVLGEQQQRG